MVIGIIQGIEFNAVVTFPTHRLSISERYSSERNTGAYTRNPSLMRGIWEDVLKDLGTNSLWPQALADRKTPTLGMIRWALSNVTDLFFRSLETCLICLPAEFVEKLHAVAMKVLLASPSGPGEERLFVSDHVGGTFDSVPSSPIFRPNSRHYNAFSVGEVPRQYLPADQPYIETEAYCALLRSSDQSKPPPFFGDISMHALSFPNWAKIDFFGLNFLAAALKGVGP
ncbi:hypothetical protein KXW57_009463 [Aspergillus fumigatus]|nr:hypothetical protein KXX64_000455 [Aspergillus fumigatus]KAH1619785.1 hypothetical protein KXX31_008356 [Aspergillus fumigatus]KAH2590852.1 hypothetical protein KXV63_008744 [Aspergillus fumigatus]KAH2712467.1 hypothetical protein KXV24_008020 [Aspergillus fumigatus]KAH2958161.1 hypothetical protein KXV49_008212 [Aspergillus fumigatus]